MRSRRRSPTTKRFGLVAAGFMALAAVSSGVYLQASQAATYSVATQAESAALAGKASLVSNSTASGSNAVHFGAINPKIGNCIAPAGLKRSVDVVDEYVSQPWPAWRHKYGDAAIIYIDTSGLNNEYRGYVLDGIKTWNASPCVDYRSVNTCPAVSNCITTEMLTSNPTGESYDGMMETYWTGSGPDDGYITDGHMTLITGLLNRESVAYRRMVVVHEMGHGVSLDHRKTRTDIMYANSGATAALVADRTNLNNILALYGFNLPATRQPLPKGTLYNPPAATQRSGETPAGSSMPPAQPDRKVIRYK